MLSVLDHDELQAVVLAVKTADRDLRRDINRATTETMNPVWKDLVTGKAGGAGGTMASRVLATGVRIAAGNPPTAKAAQSKRGIGDGKRIVPARDYAGWEFGVPDSNAYSRYQRKNRTSGGTHTVERRTMRHLPARRRKGRVVYPAFAEIGPRMVSLWVQLVVKKYADAAEGGR